MSTRSKLATLSLFGVVLIITLMLICVPFVRNSFAHPVARHQAQIVAFLQPPYYGTVGCSSVYDHEYPRFWREAEGFDPDDAFIITSTVVHYDSVRHWGLSYSGHNGIDYLLRYEPVRAAAPGDVVYAGWDEPTIHSGPDAGLGLYVHVRHSNDYDTLYGHMSVLRVETNDNILDTDEFQRILGISGNTGNSTGPHLHFELEPPNDGRSVNPYGWIGGAGNDPWENWSGLASHDVWLRYPSITNGDVYPSGAPLTAPPIDENESGYVTVDDGSADFVENPAGCWTVDNTDGWAGDYRHRVVPDGDCTARWNFPSSQPAGRYHIFIHIPNDNVPLNNRDVTVDAARYTVSHTASLSRPWDKDEDIAVVDQWVYPNDYYTSCWVYAGSYYFDTNQYGTDYVLLESETLSATGTLAADAVRFAPVVYRIYLPLVMKRWPPIPDTPVLNAIYNPNNDGNYTVSWQAAYLADTYILQEATNASFSGAMTRYSGTGTSWSAIDKAVNTYYYRVKARNSWGDSGWSNVQQTTVLPPAGWQTIASQNFEGTFPGAWIVWDDNGSSYGEYYWGKRTCRPYAGSYSGWGVGGGSDGTALACGSEYPHDADGWMYYGPFDLEDAIAGELGFKLWLYTEPDNDCVFRGASIDGIHFYGYATSGNTQGWNDKVLDLANVPTLGNLMGRSQVWVALVFSSNSSVNYAEGGYVDDVVIRKCFRGPCPSGNRLAPRDGAVREVSVTMIRNR